MENDLLTVNEVFDVLSEWARTPEAAKILHTSPSNLEKSRCYGGELDLPFIKVGRVVLYEKKALRAWLQSRTRFVTTKQEYQT